VNIRSVSLGTSVTKQDQQRADRILSFIRETVSERGYPPSVREIAEAVGLASTSAVHHHLTKLEKDGRLNKEATRSRALSLPGMNAGRVVQAPVVGEIAAGQPIHAYEERSETIGLPSELAAGRGRETFVLRVRGKSMIDDHIDEGDFVVIQEQNTARDGDIVVALLEDNVATLKRFYKEKDRIRLQPANGAMSPIYARDVQIQGKVIGVIRKLS
jgi:repressor LexA